MLLAHRFCILAGVSRHVSHSRFRGEAEAGGGCRSGRKGQKVDESVKINKRDDDARREACSTSGSLQLLQILKMVSPFSRCGQNNLLLERRGGVEEGHHERARDSDGRLLNPEQAAYQIYGSAPGSVGGQPLPLVRLRRVCERAAS